MKKTIISIVMSVGLLMACSEDVLDVKNDNAYDADSFFTTAQSYSEAVTAMYSAFNFRGMFSREWYFLFDLLGNDAFKNFPLQGDLLTYTNYTHGPTNGELSFTWLSLYKMMFRANVVIDLMENWEPEISTEEDLKSQFVGEAHFIKALTNFWLVTLYGDVPLKRTLEDHSVINDPRDPASEVWAQVEADLAMAVSNLPVSYDDPNDLGRATRGAAVALLGKTYLYQEKYQQAIGEFAKLLAAPYAYDLAASLDDMFVFDDATNPETIFAVMHGEWLGWGVGNAYYMFGGQETWGNKASHTGRAMEYGFNDWWNVLVSEPLADAFTYEDESGASYTDPRAALTFYGDGSKGGDTEFCDQCPEGPQSYPDLIQEGQLSWRKYERYELLERYNNPESPINSQIIRLADVLLMLAECYIETNQVGSALPLINRVRARSGAFEYTSLGSQQEAREILRHERRMELAGEQIRFFDLVRWGELLNTINAEKQEVEGISPVKDFHVLLPIPQAEKDANAEMVVSDNWN